MSVFGIAIRLSFLLSIGIANYVAYFVKNNKTDWSLAESYRENGITKRRYLMAVGKDWLDVIKSLKSQNLTQERIGERIGWSRSDVAKYIMLTGSVVPEVLKMANEHQQGRGTSIVPFGTTFNFTEGWFRVRLNQFRRHWRNGRQ